MAYARQCDRCKKYYNKNQAKTINGSYVHTIHIRTSGPYKELDLCDECIVDLYKFLGLEEKNE